MENQHKKVGERLDVGRCIKNIRTKKGLTLTELSTVVGIKKDVLANIESKATLNPKIKTIDKIAKALNVKLDDLMVEKVVN